MLYEVIIPIALFQQLRIQTLVSVVEVINITSCEIYIPYEKERGTTSSRNGKFTIFKIKIISFMASF